MSATSLPRPAGLFTEEGRSKLAKLVVHGADGNQIYYDHQIQYRLERILERLAESLEER